MASLKEAVAILRRGGLVGYPTESFFALGADATDTKAIRLIYTVKAREKNKPIALIASDFRQVKRFFIMSVAEERLTKLHWPGALTIVLKPRKAIAARALGASKIGVRVPRHAGARNLAKRLGRPIAATSLNISGRPAMKSRKEVARTFPGLALLSGACGPSRKPSTVVMMQGTAIKILRPGAVIV